MKWLSRAPCKPSTFHLRLCHCRTSFVVYHPDDKRVAYIISITKTKSSSTMHIETKAMYNAGTVKSPVIYRFYTVEVSISVAYMFVLMRVCTYKYISIMCVCLLSLCVPGEYRPTFAVEHQRLELSPLLLPSLFSILLETFRSSWDDGNRQGRITILFIAREN